MLDARVEVGRGEDEVVEGRHTGPGMAGSEVERARPDAWERVRAVRLCALADAPDAFGSTLEGDRALAPEVWRERLTAGAAFVATSGGEDVGLAFGAEYRGREGTAGLFGMWVAPGARGSGAGDRLVAAVVSWAGEEGFARVVLHVGDENAAAIRLYERNGFRPTGARGTLPPPRTHIREHERALDL